MTTKNDSTAATPLGPVFRNSVAAAIKTLAERLEDMDGHLVDKSTRLNLAAIEEQIGEFLKEARFEDVDYEEDARGHEPATAVDRIAALRERAENLGFQLATPPDVECAIFEPQSDHRVTFGTVDEIDEWLREHGPTYRLGCARNALYGIQALCDSTDELGAALVGVVEREARLALAELEHVEVALRDAR